MKDPHYKPLPRLFKRDGFLHEILKRDGDVVLLKKTKEGLKFLGYEVIIVQRHEGRTEPLNGCVLEPSEHSPSPILWGEKGWSYTHDDLAGAERRFAAVVQEAADPQPVARNQRKAIMKIRLKNI